MTTSEGETVEGDTMNDLPYLVEALASVSKEPASRAWKSLVEAGIIPALCVLPPWQMVSGFTAA